MDTLAFGCTLPTTGRVRDFHPLETCAAGRTKKLTGWKFIQSVIEMYPGKWTDEIVTNPLCGQMKKGHTQLADRSLTT